MPDRVSTPRREEPGAIVPLFAPELNNLESDLGIIIGSTTLLRASDLQRWSSGRPAEPSPGSVDVALTP